MVAGSALFVNAGGNAVARIEGVKRGIMFGQPVNFRCRLNPLCLSYKFSSEVNYYMQQKTGVVFRIVETETGKIGGEDVFGLLNIFHRGSN